MPVPAQIPEPGTFPLIKPVHRERLIVTREINMDFKVLAVPGHPGNPQLVDHSLKELPTAAVTAEAEDFHFPLQSFVRLGFALALPDAVDVVIERTAIEDQCPVLAFASGGVLCVVNTGSSAVQLPDGEVLIASTALSGGKLPPDSAVWLATR